MLQTKPRPLMNPQDWAAFGQQMVPFLPALAKWSLLSAGEFGKKFKDPLLRKAIPLIFGWPEIPMMAGLSILGYMSIQNAGFPVGASLDFAQAIEQRYRDLGGEIYYDAQVERILVKNDRAVGVRLYNNEEYFADYVISAGDGRSTIFDMLEGKYTNAEIRSIYDHESGFEAHSMIQISMGVKRDFSNEPHWVTYLLDKPILLAGEERDNIGLKHYCFDPTLAPQGRSALEVILRINYAYWHRIYGHKLYACEQDEVVDILTTQLEAFHPGLKADIEITDCATPLSYERYTGNWRGSSVGWLLTKKTMLKMISGMRKTLPGLKNFYLAGQWVEPGGSVPVVAMSGRNAVQLICHAERIPFTTSLVD
ncbi:MAG: NAD(P)/FAD-dependent oxidoreductase [Anaerolineaceae bacterium]|nr:NAD(P)/FAD-dependent oxidoreductase [Anaerolineaceae bacterium]